jgi:hypothetical protein
MRSQGSRTGGRLWADAAGTPLRARASLPLLALLASLGLLSLPLQGCASSSTPGPGEPTAGVRPAPDAPRLGSFTVASIGAPPGTIEPTQCLAGDNELFLGVDLVDPATALVVRLVIDPLAGPALRVFDSDARFDRSVLFFRDECTVFTMDFGSTGWIVDDIIVRRIELEVECENEDGATIRGRVLAERCG